MTSSGCPGRGRPAARIEDHETSLADDLPVRPRDLENEGTEPIGSPTDDPFLDQGSNVLDR
jgi:hypothetical protein